MVTVGLTVIAAVVAPVLQRKDIPPDAVSVAEPPMQIIGLGQVMLQDGNGFTVTVLEQELVHPCALVTVTVYVVVTLGLTVIDAVVAPVLQRKDVPPEAVSVFEPPGQIIRLPHVILHTGGVVSWLTTTSAKQMFAELERSVIVKRYVPPEEIKIESAPTPSLIPAPIGEPSCVHINEGVKISVLYAASKYCEVTLQFNVTGGRMSTAH